jgi:hypothetical protein
VLPTIEDQKKRQLMQRMSTTKDAKTNEELLKAINAKVTEIFKAAGFGDNARSPLRNGAHGGG